MKKTQIFRLIHFMYPLPFFGYTLEYKKRIRYNLFIIADVI